MTYTLKPSELYKGVALYSKIMGELKAKSMRVVAFRPPKSGEFFISPASMSVQTLNGDYSCEFPRLIVEAITAQPPLETMTYTPEVIIPSDVYVMADVAKWLDAYEVVGFHPPKLNESYLAASCRGVVEAVADHPNNKPKFIMKMHTNWKGDFWE